MRIVAVDTPFFDGLAHPGKGPISKFIPLVQTLLLHRLPAMGYYINQSCDGRRRVLMRPRTWTVGEPNWNTGPGTKSGRHSQRLVTAGAEGVLTRHLASADPAVAQLAATGLWECWLNEAGEEARQELEWGIEAMSDGRLEPAAKAFAAAMDRYPGWAEAINKLATVLYLRNKPEASIELCRRVVALKPDHFRCVERPDALRDPDRGLAPGTSGGA